MGTMSITTSVQYFVDPKKCTGCGDCIVICPVNALRLKQGLAVLVDADSCCSTSCRICELICPHNAIKAY